MQAEESIEELENCTQEETLEKKLLLKILANENLCPLTKEQFAEWKETQKFPQKALAEWFRLNPYTLRA